MSMDQFIDLCLLLGCDYLEPVKGVGPKTALKLIREHGSLANVVEMIRGKMAEKAALVASDPESEDEPVASDIESEEGTGARMITNSDGEEVEASPEKKKPTPKKKAPKKKKATAGGMSLPEHWPWEEAKQLFIKPMVVPAAELEVGP